MDNERDRALTLAHEDETRDGYAEPDAVVRRARTYLDFLRGTRDAEVINAARAFSKTMGAVS